MREGKVVHKVTGLITKKEFQAILDEVNNLNDIEVNEVKIEL
jgi:hypothetical protein